MRHRTFLLSSSLTAAAAIVFACSYGSYDGSYAGTSDGGGGEDAGTLVLSQTIDPAKLEKLTTPDAAFQVTFEAGTFDGPARITISRLADRSLNGNTLVVPAYTLTADKEPGLPFEVKFNGNAASQDPNTRLVVVFMGPDGVFRPTPMVSVASGTGGPSGNEYWGLTRKVGTFSLSFESYMPSNTGFFDMFPDSCLTKCCALAGGTEPAGALGESCACNGRADLSCFLRNCVPDVSSVLERCVEVGKTGRQNVACTSSPPCTPGSGPPCNYPNGGCMSQGQNVCCISGPAGECRGVGGPCSGIAIRCDLSTPCPEGTKCCVFENESYCASTCPAERTWCRAQQDCPGGIGDAGPNDAGPCFLAKNCPQGTCGPPPAACTN